MRKPKNTGNSAFGLFDYTMIPKLRRILKQFELRLIVHECPSEWGDQMEITIEGTKTAAVLGRLGGAALAKRRTAEQRSQSAREAALARWHDEVRTKCRRCGATPPETMKASWQRLKWLSAHLQEDHPVRGYSAANDYKELEPGRAKGERR